MRLKGQLALGKDDRLDRLVPKHPILMPLVSLPFYAAFGSIGLLIFNVAQVIALISVVYLINTRFFDTATSVAAALLFGTATLFLNYSYNYSPDVFSSLLFLTGVYLVLCRRHELCAVFLGLSVFAKLTNLPLVGVVGLYVAFDILRESRDRRAFRRLAGFGGVLALSLVPLLVTQELLYGSPWVNGYLRAVTETGFDDHVNKFNQPFVKGLLEILFHYEKGLVVTNPVLVVSAVGAFWVLRSPQRMQLLFLAALCLAQLAFFALYDEWAYSHFSNRFLMSTVALASVFAGLAIFEARERFGSRILRARGV
jgi:4-amino-4-deoxy-L-arabinose transferase-like glycosyltransferase